MRNLNIANKLLLALLVIFTIGLYSHALFFAEVSLDAGYYLSLGQQVVRGKVLYEDLLNIYTPLAMYYFAGVILFFGDAYPVLLFSLFCILFLSAYILYRCCIRITGNKVLSLCFSFLYLISCYYYDASYIYLEPFVNLFGLASVYFLLRWEHNDKAYLLFLSGALACLAFLSKQYGILYIIFCGIYATGILFYKPASTLKKLPANWLLIGAGAFLPVLFLLLVYVFLAVSPIDFFSQLIVKAYADELVGNYLNSTGSFLLKNCLLFLLVPAIYFIIGSTNKIELFRTGLFLVLLFLLTSVFYVKVFPHYSLLLLPAAFLSFASIYQVIASSRNGIMENGFFIIFWISVISTCGRTIAGFLENLNSWNREKQMETASEINKILPPQSKALLISDFHYYYLCHLQPYAPEKYGYNFFGGLWPDQKKELLEKADAILLHKQFYDRYSKQLKGQVVKINPGELLIIRK